MPVRQPHGPDGSPAGLSGQQGSVATGLSGQQGSVAAMVSPCVDTHAFTHASTNAHTNSGQQGSLAAMVSPCAHTRIHTHTHTHTHIYTHTYTRTHVQARPVGAKTHLILNWCAAPIGRLQLRMSIAPSVLYSVRTPFCAQQTVGSTRGGGA